MISEKGLFDTLCNEYYQKILYYLFSVLGNEPAARDCTQDVFLVALEKEKVLKKHPNPAGFLFLTARNLSRKYKREGFKRMMSEFSIDENDQIIGDASAQIEIVLDKQIDETKFLEAALSVLDEDKRDIYDSYYIAGKPMAEIAEKLGISETALRMRFVRLRRELYDSVKKISENQFSY